MEEKLNKDSVSSGERMRKSPNFLGFHLLIQMDKLVDEYLKRVVTLETTSIKNCLQFLVPAVTATIPLHKVKNLRGE